MSDPDPRSLWLNSPDALIQVLCVVAMNGHDARGFANLSRAFRGDEVLWGCIKDRRGPRGGTALMASARRGDHARVHWLLEQGANAAAQASNGWTSLLWACKHGHLGVVRELLAWGVDVNAAASGKGWTALMYACQEGHLEIVRELLGRGASVSAVTCDCKFTPLMLASVQGRVEVARLLLAHSASKATVSAQGHTAYDFAPAANAELSALVKP